MIARPDGVLKRRYSFLLLALFFVGLLSSGIVLGSLLEKSSAAPSAAAAPQDGCSSWRVVPSPYGGSGSERLYGTAVITSTDAWAVGDSDSGDVLTMHWDGVAWNTVSAPVSGTLQSVAAVATNDVWAVGYSVTNSVTQTLIMRWNGAEWNTVNSPNPGTGGNYLYGVTALAVNDVWAVGYYIRLDRQQALILHWNGNQWTQIPSPNLNPYNNGLKSVAAASANDVWAAGSYNDGSVDKTLVEHWNGTEWGVINSLNQGTESNNLTGIGVVPDGSVWAIGNYFRGGNSQTLAMRWDGASWIITYSQNPSTVNVLYGMAVVSANEVWAVGYSAASAVSPRRTLSLHWTGTAWGRVSSLNVGQRSNSFYGVATTGPGDVWAVGAYDNGSANQALAERYSLGPCNTPTPTFTGTPPTVTPTRTMVCGLGWRTVTNPNAGSDSRLYAVSVYSATEIWAAGTGNGRTATMHWDGTQWSTVNSPNMGPSSNILYSMSIITPRQVWAVGSYGNGTVEQTLIERWNGTIWSVITSTNVGSGSNALYGVANVSLTDVWAVGSSQDSQQTLVEHWDGMVWSVVPSPNGGTGTNYLRGIAALAANDIWAVGAYDNGGIAQNLIEHWDGNAWSVVSSVPNSGAVDNRLYAITAISPTNIWAVGSGSGSALTMHWNGMAWSLVDNPVVSNSVLYGAGALSGSDVWVVGADNITTTLTMHWDGAAWTRVPSANPNASFNTLNAVAPVTAIDAWAVGSTNPTGQTLTERYFDLCLGPTSTPTSTATSTPTITPTPTPGPGCEGGPFIDVCPSDYFYTALMYLTSHGVISGYYDNTFRPTYNTIRGQLCKIIVLAQGWTLDCPTVHFSDVPTSTVFFCFVETAYAHGIVSGYADGTFLPTNNVTRAQLSKIIVQAKHWPIDTRGGSHFTDVPQDAAFYAFIETAYHHGIIGGYSNNTFQPNNEATRGQISKIVYLAVIQR